MKINAGAGHQSNFTKLFPITFFIAWPGLNIYGLNKLKRFNAFSSLSASSSISYSL